MSSLSFWVLILFGCVVEFLLGDFLSMDFFSLLTVSIIMGEYLSNSSSVSLLPSGEVKYCKTIKGTFILAWCLFFMSTSQEKNKSVTVPGKRTSRGCVPSCNFEPCSISAWHCSESSGKSCIQAFLSRVSSYPCWPWPGLPWLSSSLCRWNASWNESRVSL